MSDWFTSPAGVGLGVIFVVMMAIYAIRWIWTHEGTDMPQEEDIPQEM